ncbi:P-loop containing nucleoside triphosphate hydrolase protein [Sporodiniella umbellata]|nr:P-loop containing nucleoside triphosphate hydrolase protein [Sporodiniella umbellata]
MSRLEIIGAGFGRTGTTSLCDALDYLGYRTHHMKNVLLDPKQDPEVFENAYKHSDQPVDWDSVYEGYTAAVDWPTSAFFDRLYALYPDVKVILTVRDPEGWFNSVYNTIHRWPGVDETWPERIRLTKRMAGAVSCHGRLVQKDLLEQKEELIQMFLDNIEYTKKIVKPENLLVMELGDGWEKLCGFLNKPIPSIPYPHSNKGECFHQLLEEIKNTLSIKN